MADNLEIWNKVRNVPTEHLKPFQRGGGFRGTAIKPIWSLYKMTEIFGPCGIGWGIKEPHFQTVQAGDEILVYCTVNVWHGAQERSVVGIGGDKVLARFKDGLKSDDEAFKKAFTDAVTNALKHLGVGADVHMGLFDGSKYRDDEADEREPKQHEPAPPPPQPTQAFMDLQETLQKIEDISSLNAWIARVKEAINTGSIRPSERATLSDRLDARRAYLAQAPGRAA